MIACYQVDLSKADRGSKTNAQLRTLNKTRYSLTEAVVFGPTSRRQYEKVVSGPGGCWKYFTGRLVKDIWILKVGKVCSS